MDETPAAHAEHDRPHGLRRWIFTTNHKDIGTLYLFFSLIMFFVAGAMILFNRLELFQPGLQITNPHFFNQLTTLHGLVMVFGAVMPAAVGFANWMIPMMIGAPDMALPRLNNLSFWILPFATTLLISSFFLPGGAAAGGWTMYPPLSVQQGPGMDFTILSVHLLGISSILGAINIIVTIMNMRAPDMTLMKMPMFVWTMLITAFLLLLALTVLAATVTMMLTDRHFGTHFFDPAGGGDPLMFQHLFWFFGHPEVYIMILPAFGIISQIVPTFSRKRLFSYPSMVYATASIAFLSAVVWGHHMFTAGMLPVSETFFMYATMLIAIPTGVKIFNWLATMWRGSLSFETPMLFAVGFIALFTIGGLSGIMVSITPADFQYQDTYFVVAHFHYVLFTGSVMAFMGAVYYWLPKWTGHMYNERLGQWHFWLTTVFANVTFFPQHFVGLAGMPRRIPDYPLQFADFNAIISIGAWGLGLSQILFAYVIITAVRGGARVDDRVWEGAQGLEWTISSPPPYHTFTKPPRIG